MKRGDRREEGKKGFRERTVRKREGGERRGQRERSLGPRKAERR